MATALTDQLDRCIDHASIKSVESRWVARWMIDIKHRGVGVIDVRHSPMSQRLSEICNIRTSQERRCHFTRKVPLRAKPQSPCNYDFDHPKRTGGESKKRPTIPRSRPLRLYFAKCQLFMMTCRTPQAGGFDP